MSSTWTCNIYDISMPVANRKRKSPSTAGEKVKKARRSKAEVAEDEIAAAKLGILI